MCTLGFVSDGCFLVLHLFGALYKRIIERITALTPVRSKITYYGTLGFVSDGCFLVLHLFGALYKRIIERITAAELLSRQFIYVW